MNSAVFKPGFVQDFVQKFFIFWNMHICAPKFEAKNFLNKGMNHTPTNDDLISNVNHFTDKLQFITNFSSSEHSKDRFFWFFYKSS